MQEKLLKFVEQSNVEIGGRSGFIFNTKHGRPVMPAGVNSFLKKISVAQWSGMTMELWE